MEMLDKSKTSNAFLNSELFVAVQSAGLFSDSKTFADATPNKPFAAILNDWQDQSQQANFDLAQFVARHFVLPDEGEQGKASDSKSDILSHINTMWAHLLRTPDAESANSLIELPNPYIVPGGRFREIYYWDTYFTALGLCEDGYHQLVLDMFTNFQHLIADNGCIPNGNRDYYRGRTQPPILTLLLELLLSHRDKLSQLDTLEFLTQAVASLEQEYHYWMRGSDSLSAVQTASLRCFRMPDGALLNRYYDEHTGPRPESWREDSEQAQQLPEVQRAQFFTDVRAACESGWDFSSRWLATPNELGSIRTTDIVPVDLNCLLWKLETSLAHHFEVLAQPEKSVTYKHAAQQRANAIQNWCWQPQDGFFMDVVFSEAAPSSTFSLAGVVPMYMGLATQEQAELISQRLACDFLKAGGLVTTLTATEQQWDSPNGWAPLQWFAVRGLENYGFQQLAQQIMDHWVNNVATCLKTHGCMLEKYNVVAPGLIAGGGEYQVQTGFGWTNGVTRVFLKKLNQA